MDAVNFVQVSKLVASSGQPSIADFQQIADLGYQTVINLALSSAENAISHEGNVVTELGLTHLHIPVQWERPMLAQFELFASVMQNQRDKKVWVHCALNMRVSAFLYLYNVLHLNVPEEEALEMMHQVWHPNEVWTDFIASVQGGYA